MKMKTEMTTGTKQFDLLALHESSSKVSMTSQDIAELVVSRHSDVKRSIERLAERGVIRKPPMQFLERINNLGLAVQDEVYNFEGDDGKRDSIIVVAQLRPELTAQIVDRWRELESGKALPHSTERRSAINPDFVTLIGAVTESTASAIMKATLEATGIQATVQITAVVTSQEGALPVKDAPAVAHSEFMPIHNVSWATGLSDATCRRLIVFAALPARHIEGIRGLCVHREAFIAAAKTLIDESTSPKGKRKRWQHPEFGGFELRKDPVEIFGEVK